MSTRSKRRPGGRNNVARPSLFDQIGEDFRQRPLTWRKNKNSIWVWIIAAFLFLLWKMATYR